MNMNKLNTPCPKCGGSLCLQSDFTHEYKWRAICLTCGYHTQDWRETQVEAIEDWCTGGKK